MKRFLTWFKTGKYEKVGGFGGGSGPEGFSEDPKAYLERHPIYAQSSVMDPSC